MIQVGCMRQVLGLVHCENPEGQGGEGGGRGGSGWGIHVNPWLIHVNVWQKPLQYYKVISLQLIKIIGEKKKDDTKSCPMENESKRTIMEIPTIEKIHYS